MQHHKDQFVAIIALLYEAVLLHKSRLTDHGPCIVVS